MISNRWLQIEYDGAYETVVAPEYPADRDHQTASKEKHRLD